MTTKGFISKAPTEIRKEMQGILNQELLQSLRNLNELSGIENKLQELKSNKFKSFNIV